MKNTQYTPNSWVVQVSTDSDGDDTNDIKSRSPVDYGRTVASEVNNDDDARLISSAPDMAEELRLIVSGLSETARLRSLTPWETERLLSAQETLKKAGVV